MQDHRKDAEYIPKKAYVVTMLIRGGWYYYERFPVDAESAAHAIDQVIDWLQNHTDTCEWADFEFKAVEERGRKRR